MAMHAASQIMEQQYFACVLVCCLQGATDAHEFFVLESGSCDVFVTRPGDITAKKVKSYGAGSAFGELALLYAAPRAATVSRPVWFKHFVVLKIASLYQHVGHLSHPQLVVVHASECNVTASAACTVCACVCVWGGGGRLRHRPGYNQWWMMDYRKKVPIQSLCCLLSCQVVATSPCKLWVAERRVVTTIKRHFAEKAAASKLELLDKVPMFGVLTDAHKQLLAGALELVSVGCGLAAG
jgi:hypothetical protein